MIEREITRAMNNLVAPDKNLSDSVDARWRLSVLRVLLVRRGISLPIEYGQFSSEGRVG